MKREDSVKIDKHKRDLNVTSIKRSTVLGDVHTGPMTINNFRKSGRSVRPTEYPDGSIGRDLLKRNYVKYLVEHYHRFREADSGFGRVSGRFSYAVIFKNIEREFKAPTYFIPESRFQRLVDYLQDRIDKTILGKRNRGREIPNYLSFDEFAQGQKG